MPGCSSAPATLACACNLSGFCKSASSPRWGSCREGTVLGDSAGEPLSELSQALFQHLPVLLLGAMSTNCRSLTNWVPQHFVPPAQHPSQGWLRPWPLPLHGTAVHKQLHRVSPAGCTALINDPVPESKDRTANVQLSRLRGGQQTAQPCFGNLTVLISSLPPILCLPVSSPVTHTAAQGAPRVSKSIKPALQRG